MEVSDGIALHYMQGKDFTPSPWRGKVGMGGGQHGMGASPAFTPTLALPHRRGGDPLEPRQQSWC